MAQVSTRRLHPTPTSLPACGHVYLRRYATRTRRGGGICHHLPSGTEIDATAGAATAATATGYTTDAAATAAAIAVNADAAAAATIVPRYSSAGQPPIRSGGQRRAATRRTRAQSRPHRRGLLSMLTNEHNIGQVFVEKRPPSQSLAKAPTCPAS